MVELKPKKRRTVKKEKPIEEPKVEGKKEDDSWEDFLNDDSFNEPAEEKKDEKEIVDSEDEEVEEEVEDEDEIIAEPVTKLKKEEEEKKEGTSVKVGDIRFPVLDKMSDGKKINQDMFGNIPIEVTVELGRTSVSLKDVYELSEGSIIELERLAGEPLDLVVNGQIVAHGEVVAVDDNYGLRITKILTEQ